MAKTKGNKTGLVEVDSLGTRLKLMLEARGWNASDLVEATLNSGAGGVALPSITRALNSERSLTVATAIRIAAALGISLDELFDYDPDNYTGEKSGTRRALKRSK